jgi:hypothetical protein
MPSGKDILNYKRFIFLIHPKHKPALEFIKSEKCRNASNEENQPISQKELLQSFHRLKTRSALL